jgi:hypothetical protein
LVSSWDGVASATLENDAKKSRQQAGLLDNLRPGYGGFAALSGKPLGRPDQTSQNEALTPNADSGFICAPLGKNLCTQS